MEVFSLILTVITNGTLFASLQSCLFSGFSNSILFLFFTYLNSSPNPVLCLSQSPEMPSNVILCRIHEVWQSEDYIPPSAHSSPFDELSVEVYINFLSISSSSSTRRDQAMVPTVYKSFRQKLEHLVKDPTSWSTISSMLSQVNVPYNVQPLMIGRISEAARSIASSASGNLNLRTLPAVVSIHVTVPVDEEPEFSTKEESNRPCIKELEKVRVGKDCVDNYRCVICLEEIPVGSEAISMPCLHFYHENCIVNWLQRSSLCPLCRFQIPLGLSASEEY